MVLQTLVIQLVFASCRTYRKRFFQKSSNSKNVSNTFPISVIAVQFLWVLGYCKRNKNLKSAKLKLVLLMHEIALADWYGDWGPAIAKTKWYHYPSYGVSQLQDTGPTETDYCIWLITLSIRDLLKRRYLR